MDFQKLMELWDRFDGSAASEMELDMEGVHFALKKQTAGKAEECPAYLVTEPAATVPEAAFMKSETQSASPSSQEKNAAAGIYTEIKAPLVGAFYIAPSPESEPFIKVGDKVKRGDVIGIIEAMKLMNEVTSDAEGIVAEILPQDGSLVEYGQVLVRLTQE